MNPRILQLYDRFTHGGMSRRGFLGIRLLGRTQVWVRDEGP